MLERKTSCLQNKLLLDAPVSLDTAAEDSAPYNARLGHRFFFYNNGDLILQTITDVLKIDQ